METKGAKVLITGSNIEDLTTDEIYDANQVNVTALMHLTQGFVGGMMGLPEVHSHELQAPIASPIPLENKSIAQAIMRGAMGSR